VGPGDREKDPRKTPRFILSYLEGTELAAIKEGARKEKGGVGKSIPGPPRGSDGNGRVSGAGQLEDKVGEKNSKACEKNLCREKGSCISPFILTREAERLH